MKEFRWNKISFFCFENNLQRFDFLKSKVQDFSKQNDFKLLRDALQIFTRETLTSKYLSIEFANQGIPSLHFSTRRMRELYDFCLLEYTDRQIVSDEALVFLIAEIIAKSKSKKNFGAVYSLAETIFSKWQESILKQKEIDLKPEFKDSLEQFLKYKDKKNIVSKIESRQIQIDRLQFHSEEFLNSKIGEEIFLYGVNEIDSLHADFLKELSKKIKINFLINEPIVQNEFNSDGNLKFKDVLVKNHVLSIFCPDEESIFANMSTEKTEIHFRECQEIYREIDFIGRDILREMNELKNGNLQLNRIKVLIPDDIQYHSLIVQVFQRMNIPFASTINIQTKLSSYHIAVISLLNLSVSNFNKEDSFSVFYNPCFIPDLGEGRMNLIDPDDWNSILSKLNLSEFLDSKHRNDSGFRKTQILTWESLWKQLSFREIQVDINDLFFDSDKNEQIEYFMNISSSLLYDLIGSKQDFSELKDYANFFKTVFEIYLSPKSRNGEENYYNEKAKRNIDSEIESLISISDELKKIGFQKKITLEEFVKYFKEKITNIVTGDSKLLESGVVIGTLVDSLDPSFDKIYVLGLEEKRFSISSKSEEIILDSAPDSDLILKQKYNFYHILSQNANSIHLSYINLDSVKDRVYYPYREFTELQKKYSLQTENISLSQIDEQDGKNTFEKEMYDLVGFQKYLETDNSIQRKIPEWIQEENSESKNIQSQIAKSGFPFHEKIKEYLYRSEIQNLESSSVSEISSKQLSSYLECPKKYLYNSKLSLLEEDEESGETLALSSFGWRKFIEIIIEKFIETKSWNPKKILEDFFITQNIQNGFLPIGLLNQVEEEKQLLQLENRIIPFFQDLMSEGYTFYPKPQFDSKLKRNTDKPYFSTIVSSDDSIYKINIDLWMRKENKIYFTSLSTSKNKNSQLIKKINSAFAVHIAEEFSQRREIEDFFQMQNLEFLPNLLILNQKEKLENIIVPHNREESKKFFNTSVQANRENFFPASPFSLEEDICKFCKIKSSCFGYNKSFQTSPLVEASENFWRILNPPKSKKAEN